MNIRAKIFGRGSAREQSLLQSKKPKGAAAEALDSVAVPRSEPRRSNSRLADRHRLTDEMVRVTYGGADHQVELINLSGGGAMVSGGLAPMLWDKVELHLGSNGTIECAVRWLKGDRMGLEFAHETRLDCPADERADLLRAVISRSFPDLEFEIADAEAEPAAPEEPGKADDSRRAPRHPLIWSGVLHHDYQSTPVRVRNVSSTGAMIETATPVRVGAEPLLELCEAASISATVEWVVGDQVGLRFHEPFDMSMLAAARPEIAPARWKRPAYLDSAGRADSPWDPEWQRLSMSELKQELEGFLKR